MKRTTLFILCTFTSLAAFGLVYFLFNQGSFFQPAQGAEEHEHDLVPVKSADGEIDYWTCTMHPSVKMKEPGTCPICGMDLIPVRPGPAQGLPGSLEAAADKSVFTIDPRQQQLIKVQTIQVAVRPLSKAIRTVGTIELDETKIEHIHTKIKGWIEKVFVDFNLQHVQKGDPLFSIYSPELVATQEEYLLALRTAEELSASSFQNVSSGARSLLEATRRRLELFDITDEQIRELEKTGKAQKNLIVYSPVSGHVIARNAYPNMYINPGTQVYSLADHTRIWAMVDIYENEISYVKPGQMVSMTTPAYPGEVFRGKLTYVYPHLEQNTRTMQVRLEFVNPDLKLKPNMYVNVNIDIPLGSYPTVPQSAVLRTGTRDLVFVDLGSGSMQLRRVKLGVEADGYYQILEGVKVGDKVVSAANFLIDAESKVQGVEAAWETPKPKGDL